MARSMTFRIETVARGRFTVFVLSGRIEILAIAGFRRLFELQKDCHHTVLDLKDQDQVSYRSEFISCFEWGICDFGGERTARERQG
jgi:hypothetical protein